MYTGVFLRLEPLGLELIAAVARDAGHEVRIIDLQVETHAALGDILQGWTPDAVCFSGNYLANVPEIIDLSRSMKASLPGAFIFVGGHSVSFVAEDLLRHAGGAVDCVLVGEGEASVAALLDAVEAGGDILATPGVVTLEASGPPPRFVDSLDAIRPARDLLKRRRRYFIGTLDPAASIEFSRGCPWDCTFCSAWTFYGRSYRAKSSEVIADELAHIAEPGVFIVDDVAFIHAERGLAIAEAVRRRGVKKKKYYLETRADVLLRNREVFSAWRDLGLDYVFMGLEAIDEEGLKAFRKRIHLDKNMEALEFARSLGLTVAINLIAEPDWDRQRFETVRQWCLEVPEVVNLTVMTPYPGTETWRREQPHLTTLDYRLFDIQHAVVPTRLPLAEFYEELIRTQQVLNRKHLGFKALFGAAGEAARLLAHGQTNFIRMLWKFNSAYDARRQLADHAREVRYPMSPPPRPVEGRFDPKSLYVHPPVGRRERHIDEATERFVDQTRMQPGAP
jgi:hopanoid C-3 methylase HpnR